MAFVYGVDVVGGLFIATFGALSVGVTVGINSRHHFSICLSL